MRKLNLTKAVMEIDGVSPLQVPRQIMGENGYPTQVMGEATFKGLIADGLRNMRLNPLGSEKDADFEGRVMAFFDLTKRVAATAGEEEFSDEEIAILKQGIAGSQTFIFGQFLEMLEAE